MTYFFFLSIYVSSNSLSAICWGHLPFRWNFSIRQTCTMAFPGTVCLAFTFECTANLSMVTGSQRFRLCIWEGVGSNKLAHLSAPFQLCSVFLASFNIDLFLTFILYSCIFKALESRQVSGQTVCLTLLLGSGGPCFSYFTHLQCWNVIKAGLNSDWRAVSQTRIQSTNRPSYIQPLTSLQCWIIWFYRVEPLVRTFKCFFQKGPFCCSF